MVARSRASSLASRIAWLGGQWFYSSFALRNAYRISNIYDIPAHSNRGRLLASTLVISSVFIICLVFCARTLALSTNSDECRTSEVALPPASSTAMISSPTSVASSITMWTSVVLSHPVVLFAGSPIGMRALVLRLPSALRADEMLCTCGMTLDSRRRYCLCIARESCMAYRRCVRQARRVILLYRLVSGSTVRIARPRYGLRTIALGCRGAPLLREQAAMLMSTSSHASLLVVGHDSQ